MIKINNLNKFFFKGRQNEIHVINDISLEMPETGLVAIFGKSGCGKTTLLNVLGGLDRYDSGSFTVEGQDLKSNENYIRNKYIGYIFQNYNLIYNKTVYENVADALRLCGITDEEVIRHRVTETLKSVDMEKFIKRNPETLSGGQRQRVAIARALVKSPRIILADEPTGNLDDNNTIMVMDLLKTISKDRLVILVTHENNLVDYYCDKVINLFDGRVASIKENENANGISQKNRNNIYLGEYEKREESVGNVNLSYYGDDSAEAVDIQVVNRDGKIFLKLSPNVKVLTDSDETKFVEGVYVEEKTIEKAEFNILPDIEGKNYGKLFTFGKSIKEGFRDMSVNTKSLKGLKNCLGLFVIILLLFCIMRAKDLKSMVDIENSFSHNLTYVYVDSQEIYDKLVSDDAKNYGIDNVKFTNYTDYSDSDISVYLGKFNNYTPSYLNDKNYIMEPGVKGHGVKLPASAMSDKKLLYGRNTDIADEEVVISSTLADMLIENVTVEYINKREHLLGFYVTDDNIRRKIVGIIDSSESAVYYSNSLIKESNFEPFNVSALDDDNTIKAGEVRVELNDPLGLRSDEYKVGETLEIGNSKYTIVAVDTNYYPYSDYLKKIGATEVIEADESVYENKFDYLEMYYGFLSSYFSECVELNPALYNIPEEAVLNEETVAALINILEPDSRYYAAFTYKNIIGAFPTEDEANSYMVGEEYLENILVNHGINVKGTHTLHLANGTAGDLYEGIKLEGRVLFAEVHTTDTKKTEQYLSDVVDFNKTISANGKKAYISPEMIRAEKMKSLNKTLRGDAMILGGVLAVMCVVVFMVMRSIMMSKTKEIGIYRAIGVSRANVIEKYLVETIPLFVKCILPKYLFISGIVVYINYFSALNVSIYYPVWMMAILLAFLFIVTEICGILPACFLLRKTPSEILAKYDV